MFTKEELIEFLQAFGWEERSVRNSLMWAFRKDDMSLNYYPSNGTLTVQKKTEDQPYGVFVINKKRLRKLEEIELALEELK